MKTVYYIRIKNENKKSEGLVESCAGDVIFRNRTYRTIWDDNQMRHYSFGKEGSLKLFDIYKDVLKFTHLRRENMSYVTPDFEYADIQEESITIELEAARGHCPSAYSEKIKDIIEKAIVLYPSD
jgi:hypothetical protein